MIVDEYYYYELGSKEGLEDLAEFSAPEEYYAWRDEASKAAAEECARAQLSLRRARTALASCCFSVPQLHLIEEIFEDVAEKAAWLDVWTGQFDPEHGPGPDRFCSVAASLEADTDKLERLCTPQPIKDARSTGGSWR